MFTYIAASGEPWKTPDGENSLTEKTLTRENVSDDVRKVAAYGGALPSAHHAR